MDRLTAVTRARYDRIAPVYDAMQWFMERSAARWRRRLWSLVSPGRVLEVGVGTGRNMEYYRPDVRVTGIDLSGRMLERARRRAGGLGIRADLYEMNTEQLAFPDASFDVAVATFVFCSVQLPVRGLEELSRVVEPGGEIWLLEHVRVDRPFVGLVMDALNPIVVRMVGANINRRTVENVRRAGLELVSVENLQGELVKLIRARPAPSGERRIGARKESSERLSSPGPQAWDSLRP